MPAVLVIMGEINDRYPAPGTAVHVSNMLTVMWRSRGRKAGHEQAKWVILPHLPGESEDELWQLIGRRFALICKVLG